MKRIWGLLLAVLLLCPSARAVELVAYKGLMVLSSDDPVGPAGNAIQDNFKTLADRTVFEDNTKFTIGDDEDIEFYFDASDSYIDATATAGSLNVRVLGADNDIILQVLDGAVTKTITWDASVDKLVHSAGQFEFGDEVAITATDHASGLLLQAYESYDIDAAAANQTMSHFIGNITNAGTHQFASLAAKARYTEADTGDQTGYWTPLYVFTSYEGGASSAATQCMGIYNRMELNSDSSDTGDWHGIYSQIQIADTKTGTIGVAYGFLDNGITARDGTVGTGHSIYLAAHTKETGSFVHARGITLAEQDVGSSSNWQIYSNGGHMRLGGDNDKLYLGDTEDAYIQNAGTAVEVINVTEDMDLVFGVDDGGVGKTITWDADVDKLKHSTGTFDFDDDNLTTTGNISVGIAPDANRLRLSFAPSDTSNAHAIKAVFSPVVTDDLTVYSKGLYVDLAPSITNGKTNSGYLLGVHSEAITTAALAGTLAQLDGLRIQYGHYAGTGTITDVRGINLVGYYKTGTTGDLYGIYIDATTTGGTLSGSEWAIYSINTADSRFTGDLQFDADDKGIVLGDGQDDRIDHDGTYLELDPATAVEILDGLIIPNGTDPTPAAVGGFFLDTDAGGANGSLMIYSNGAWRTVKDFN